MTTLTRRQLLHAGGLVTAAAALRSVPALAAPAGAAAGITTDPLGPGYWILMRDGRVLPRGSARGEGRADAFSSTASAVAAHPIGGGFWRVRPNGRTEAFGRATVTADAKPNRRGDVVGIAPHYSGRGFWRVTDKGQVFATGASTHLGGARSGSAVTGIAAHPEATGYWIVNQYGRVYAFGAAREMGSPAGPKVVGITPHPSGGGYWLVRSDGRVFAYGASAHHGNASIDVAVIGISAAPDGAGYWILARDGRIRAFGSARNGMIATEAPPTPEVTTVGGIVVATLIAKKVRALLGHAADDGVKLGGWGYRSYARQVELRQQNCGLRYYDVYVKSSSECSPMTAIPGRSMHEKALAIDFYRKLKNGSIATLTSDSRAFKWMSRHAKTYGLYNLPSEPWHWSTTGG